MIRTSLILGLTFSLTFGGMLLAQRGGGIDPAAIATALPLEGAPLAVPGPYKIESGPAFNSPGHVVYRPSDLTPFPSKDTLPLIVWGNGGCAINSNRYAGFLTTIASHGFVVMATAAQPGVTRATADHLRAAIAWAVKLSIPALPPVVAALLIIGPYGVIFLAMTLALRIPDAASMVRRLASRR